MTKTAEPKKQPKIVVSGVQPSGRSHIGNYAGSYRNWLKLQDDPAYRCFFFIADYHSITEDYNPAAKRQQVFDLAADLLALGLDPEKCTLFVQSDVPEHTELGWIFNTVTPVSFLERMTQFKDKSGRQQENINMGLFDYPVLMSADILIYKGGFVPVGRDQTQHVELTRDIAHFFNNKFGNVFPEAKPLYTETPKLRSLTNPLKKMSKSLGDRSLIALTDEPDVIYDKIKSAVTESTGILSLSEEELEHKMTLHAEAHEDDPALRGVAGVWNLLTLLRTFGSAEEADRILAAQPIKYAELKRLVATRIAEHFADFRERRKKLVTKPKKVWEILEAGAKEARSVAKKTMTEVRERIGIR
ncbi:MAG: tryptophan--tRNA ligase [Patescibacteria group bacterium]|jgi:tryptophanyl-tRNA synthetase